jgi:anti-sigma factor RsiW
MTGRIILLDADRHREIQVLLPWYLAGRLSDDEQAGVKAHLGVCSECQAEARAERRLAEEVADLPPVAGARGVEQGWRAMRNLIEQDKRRSLPGLAARLWRGAALQWNGETAWMRWALAAQSCLLVMGGATLWWTTQAPTAQPAAYRALAAAPERADGNMVVIFRPDTTERDLREILRASNARLIDGPTAADAYVVRVPQTERNTVLSVLRRKAQIVLAEPIDAGGPS